MKNKENCATPEDAMKVLKIIGMVLLGIAAAFAFGFVIQLLWNWLMPMLFNLPTVTYWQGIGILILSSILFGRLGGSSGDSKKKKKHKDKDKDSIKSKIKEEFRKEFEKEYGRVDYKETNENYEDLYEKWWEEEGESAFEKYASRNKDDSAE